MLLWSGSCHCRLRAGAGSWWQWGRPCHPPQQTRGWRLHQSVENGCGSKGLEVFDGRGGCDGCQQKAWHTSMGVHACDGHFCCRLQSVSAVVLFASTHLVRSALPACSLSESISNSSSELLRFGRQCLLRHLRGPVGFCGCATAVRPELTCCESGGAITHIFKCTTQQ